jgi:hypothetical protein
MGIVARGGLDERSSALLQSRPISTELLLSGDLVVDRRRAQTAGVARHPRGTCPGPRNYKGNKFAEVAMATIWLFPVSHSRSLFAMCSSPIVGCYRDGCVLQGVRG